MVGPDKESVFTSTTWFGSAEYVECGQCEAWRGHRCVRKSAQMIADDGIVGRWPETLKNDGCFEGILKLEEIDD